MSMYRKAAMDEMVVYLYADEGRCGMVEIRTSPPTIVPPSVLETRRCYF